jgi:dGTP triphosphohydrolase
MGMDWSKLVSARRMGREQANMQADPRSAFPKDRDRLVYSSAFRPMQDKPHAFPQSDSNYVRP